MSQVMIEPCFCGKVGSENYESYCINTDSEDEAALLNAIKDKYIGRPMKHFDNWKKSRPGTDIYSNGYYKLAKTRYGYLLTLCMPIYS